MTGRFGRLLIVNSIPEVTHFPSGRRRLRYECKCDCGATVLVKKQDLVTGHTSSCGCFRRECHQLPPGEAGFRWLYRTYKAGAKVRGIEFDLDEIFFRELTQQNCFYCGSAPQSIAPADRRDWTEHAKYIYNGIDRVDNAHGYSRYNCVSACTTCNVAKKEMTAHDFLAWISRVFNFQKGKNVQS